MSDETAFAAVIQKVGGEPLDGSGFETETPEQEFTATALGGEEDLAR